MLDLRVEIKNGNVVLDGLQKLAGEFPAAVKRGLKRAAIGIYDHAMQWLSGAGGKTQYRQEFQAARGIVRTRRGKIAAAAGGYPVPVRTEHLRRSLDWLSPGVSKAGDLGTFTAGENEVVIFNAASYAPAIFLGLGSSSEYGPRDALKDALELFQHGANIERVIGEEIQKELNKSK